MVKAPAIFETDFTVICNDASMINARIFDGDIAYIRQQDTVENGELAAVLIDGGATIRRVWISDDYITLEPANPRYRSLVCQRGEVRILGKVVGCSFVIQA